MPQLTPSPYERPRGFMRLFSSSSTSSSRQTSFVEKPTVARVEMAQAMGTLIGPGNISADYSDRLLIYASAKLAAVTELVDKLSKDLETVSLLPQRKSNNGIHRQ